MTTVTLTFDPDNPAEVEKARALLDRLVPAHEAPDPETVRQRVIALLRGYGEKRTEYIRHVAQASPGSADYDDLVAIVGSPKAVGGTHSAIERAWRAKNMPGPFIATDDLGGAHMDAALADIVLAVLHDVIDEPDPLRAATF
ncbi:hypothetical protein [Kineosporia sp. NBRC 101731]|uniref:hypothetical protein n=1 Tax=Kineosporia sp. NBRC 101731 TaxID=3032199 RepID=UPI0024A4DA68|nr:hypothetical protein [Kineosporia sp. NBRC 101731]GLY32787.1 hypothetical protein Kisp02_61520 [Kineosporia sp. NBRC 101731]